ncbi:MAG: signal peptidase II [Clostridia bacterium]|nr:signal peptidase II [Clostridia bacterium]
MNIRELISRSIKWWYLLIIGIIIVDLVTKAILDGKEMGAISGFFSFVSVHNTGASYGMFSDKPFAQVMFIIIALVFAGGLICFDLFYKKKIAKNIWYKLALVLILGGLFGNLIDRVALGYVRDFIHLDFMSFPVFNIADIALTVGCICFIIYVIFYNPFGQEDEGNQNPKLEENKNAKVENENEDSKNSNN